VRHPEPIVLHETAPPHFPGAPSQCLLQHSAPVTHAVPSSRQGAVQTRTPPLPVMHVPRQQSPSCVQSEPVARQGPGPNAHRFDVVSQTPQHVPVPPELHDSPVARHPVRSSDEHVLSSREQTPEQQSASTVHDAPDAQKVPPQIPPWQAIEQQSSACVHFAPSATQ
jgi:hypothetical protein